MVKFIRGRKVALLGTRSSGRQEVTVQWVPLGAWLHFGGRGEGVPAVDGEEGCTWVRTGLLTPLHCTLKSCSGKFHVMHVLLQ